MSDREFTVGEGDQAQRVTVRSHTGADFEAGRTHWRNERTEGAARSDGRDPEEGFGGGGGGSARASGIARFLTGAPRDVGGNDSQNGPGTKRKSGPETLCVEYKGQQLTVFKGTHAAEDSRWVYILEVKENGTNKYKCVACGWERVCKVGVVVNHLLRLEGSVCSKLPTVAMTDALSRFTGGGSSSAALATAAKSPAAGKTPGLLVSGFNKQEQSTAEADMALAKLVCTFDLSWAVFDSRNQLWVDVVKKIQEAGPTFSPARRETLSSHLQRSEGSRPGGLYLADQACQRERRHVVTSITGEPSLGGTLVSDCAKIKTKKRSMLNSSLVTGKGVLPVQSTDATGKKKDGPYLAEDLSVATEKLGHFEVISRTRPSGLVVEKKSSQIVKIVILDRGGGCERALSIYEDKWCALGDTCKGHGADLLIEDWARPFKTHLKQCHEVIIFIITHDAIYALFTSYEGVRSLDLPADTRFATEVICVRSLVLDKLQVKKLFVDPKYDAWLTTQDSKIRAKARKYKELCLSDVFWHKSDAFLALEEIAETSLRILDSNEPNLKDTAFAFRRIELEVADPLVSKLANIPDWGEIDLGLHLRSEHPGNLASFAKAMVKKRKPDFMSTPVLAAAAVNPIYSFATLDQERWAVPGGDAAVRICIAKLFWGEDSKQGEAIDGWDRFHNKEGIYEEGSDQIGTLRQKANSNNAIGFYRHVYSASRLAADKAFAQFGLWLVSAFANQGAAERHNKYVADMHTKKRAAIDMGKAEAMVNVKMTEMYKRAAQRGSASEQRKGERSVAQDLRMIYMRARTNAAEKRELERRLTALRAEGREETEQEAAGDEAALVTREDAADVLGEGESPLRVPSGYKIVSMAPDVAKLDPTSEVSNALLNQIIVVRFDDYGWCQGTIIEKVDDGRRTIARDRVNFVAKFDIDDGETTDLSLDAAMYDPSPSADYESWMLLEKEEDDE